MQSAVITVFGGTGFLGAAIVRALLRRGAWVRVAARRVDRKSTIELPKAVSIVRADIRDEASIEAALAGSSAAINAVGLYVENQNERFQSVHVHGAGRLARVAARAGVNRMVHVSGIGASPTSASSYVRSREAGERAVLEHFPQAAVVRPSVLFGPGDSFLCTIDAITRRSPIFPLFGNGGTRLQPVFVDDVADAIAGIAERSATNARFHELGGPRIFTYRQIVEAVLHFRGRRRALLPVPFWMWMLQARALAFVSNPPLTVDQVILMRTDNVVGRSVATFDDLGITPRDLEMLLPLCLASKSANK